MQRSWEIAFDPPALATKDVHVWSVPLDRAQTSWMNQLATLAADERERARRFRLDEPRRRFVVARAALRAILGKYLQTPAGDVAFVYDPNGKPRLRNSAATNDLNFNLAHSGELALIAITRGCEVGVDVERLREVRYLAEIAERYFHPDEVAAIDARPAVERNAAFLRCWAAKEAVLKAIGTGITQALDFYAGLVEPGHATWIEAPVKGTENAAQFWLQPLLPEVAYVGAVACMGAERELHCYKLHD